MPKTALITGATAGIGHAFAIELATRGHDLILVARNQERLKTVAKQLKEDHGVDVRTRTGDLSTTAGINRVAKVVEDGDRPVDLLVNCAGYALRRRFTDNPIADEEAVLNVMVRAPMHLTHTALNAMAPRRRGAIVNVSSVAGFTPRGTYGAHKAWVISFSRWAHFAYADQGVKVMALCPGFVHTEFHERMGARTDNIPDWMWLDAREVVRQGLTDLDRGAAVSIPTLRWKAIATLSRITPARIVARVAKLGR
ncbi:MAG: SDR family NAD(P)-dependent oxidoreductase [Nocardioidaceae bacterium]